MRWIVLLAMILGLFIAPLGSFFPSTHHRTSHPISTVSALAQYYFDQGLLFAYGFNHTEAYRSFQTAVKLDSNCAMCYWGMAYVLGSNINTEMPEDRMPIAWEAMQKAVSLQSTVTPAERAYIQALSKRYTASLNPDRASLNLAYAHAMREVAQNYPTDLDAATLFAEALMDTMPWNYGQDNGEPKPEGREIIDTLQSVLTRDRNHIGALHFYIHAVEEKHPELAIAVADRLRDLHLPLGHLVHMPSHIYLRVGRYQDAVRSNQEAISVDQKTLTQNGIYRFAYIPHNQHFLWYAATLAGEQQIALQAAEQTAKLADPDLLRKPGYGTLQHYLSIPLYAWVKFRQWDKIIAQPAPESDLAYPTGVWHYARGLAWAHQREFQKAEAELEQLRAIVVSPALSGVTIWDVNTTADLLQIGSEVLAAEIAAKRGQIEQAISGLRSAIAKEDHLTYDEPAPWHSPVRQTLGALLLEQNRSAEAAQVFREDLAIYPNNVWSLRGLAESLRKLKGVEN
jgi:tetratricopeptide (TPR) repeat protein